MKAAALATAMSRALTLPAPSTPVARRDAPEAAHAVIEDIVLWTTRDGREIPIDDMSDEHLRNAVAALSRWRSRIRKGALDKETERHLTAAIDRFRRMLRKRERGQGGGKMRRQRSSGSFSGLPRKPVART